MNEKRIAVRNNKNNGGSKKRRAVFAVCIVAAAAVFCFILAVSVLDRTIQLRSDSSGVEFVAEGERITGVNISGRFPYQFVFSPVTKESKTDESGTVTEEITIYTIQAELSWTNSKVSMKINIEPSDEIIRTYVLKFSDRDVMIRNGKEVEQES